MFSPPRQTKHRCSRTSLRWQPPSTAPTPSASPHPSQWKRQMRWKRSRWGTASSPRVDSTYRGVAVIGSDLTGLEEHWPLQRSVRNLAKPLETVSSLGCYTVPQVKTLRKSISQTAPPPLPRLRHLELPRPQLPQPMHRSTRRSTSG